MVSTTQDGGEAEPQGGGGSTDVSYRPASGASEAGERSAAQPDRGAESHDEDESKPESEGEQSQDGDGDQQSEDQGPRAEDEDPRRRR